MTDQPFLAGDPGGLGRSAADLRAQVSGLSDELTAELADAVRAMQAADRQAKGLGRTLGTGLRGAFDALIFKGESLSSVLRGVAVDLARSSFAAAISPLQGAVSRGVTSLIGGAAKSLFSGLTGFQDGAAFGAGRVRAFANGGVLGGGVAGGPTAFPMRGGVGLLGEAGPEAILPLRRGPDGKLGVAAGAGAAPRIVVNISTPDPAAFRQSQGQISAALARAVARGRRNL